MIQRRDQPGTGESEPRGIVSASGLAAAITSPAMIVVLWLGVFIHAIALMAQLPARATSFSSGSGNALPSSRKRLVMG